MEIINLILAVLAAVGSLAGYTLYIFSRVQGAAAGAISESEEEGKSGKEKFKNAVDSVYALVPVPMRVIITREIVENIIQATFDKVERYACKQKQK